jgi:CheY-like chemotaxis protein
MKQKLNCILLIDDDEATNYFSNFIIEEADCAVHVKTRQTAKAALKYLSDSGHLVDQPDTLPFPDLIFLDINMPAMDGWEFLEKYKTIESSFPQKPTIIMLSTSLNPDDKLKALNIPEVAEFQNKPITVDMLNAIFTKYFPGYVNNSAD